jgi:hypothetical protein
VVPEAVCPAEANGLGSSHPSRWIYARTAAHRVHNDERAGYQRSFFQEIPDMRNIIRTALIVGTLATLMISMADPAKKDDAAKTDEKKTDDKAAPKTDAKKTDAKKTDAKKTDAKKTDEKKTDAKTPETK